LRRALSPSREAATAAVACAAAAAAAVAAAAAIDADVSQDPPLHGVLPFVRRRQCL
jgi:hypothetical protein